MGTRKAAAATRLEPVEELRRQVAALTDASTERHRLQRGTTEYDTALETEERLAERVWRLGAALRPGLDAAPPSHGSRKSEG
jgi:hypothetical protein